MAVEWKFPFRCKNATEYPWFLLHLKDDINKMMSVLTSNLISPNSVILKMKCKQRIEY